MSTPDFDPSNILKAFQNYSSANLNPVEETELTYEEIIEKSTLQSSQTGVSIPSGSLGGPSLALPDAALLQLNSTMSEQEITQLKNDHLKQLLEANPEILAFLNNAGLHSNDLISKDIPGITSENSTSLITQNIVRNMDALSSLYGDNPNFQTAFNSAQASMMEAHYPSTSFLKDLLINQYISQGASMNEAVNLANQQIVNIVNQKMEESGLTPPVLTPRPEMGEALVNHLTALSVNSTDSPISPSDLQHFLAQAGFTNIFGNGLQTLSIQSKSASPTSDSTTTVSVDTINKMVESESDKLQMMLNTVRSFPMPGEMKLGFLEFLQTMAKSLEDLKAFSNQIALIDAKNIAQKKNNKLQQVSLNLESQMEKIQEALDKLKEAEDMKDKLGPLANVANVMNILMLVVAAIVLVALTIMFGPFGFIIGLVLVSAIVTFYAINQTGDMSTMVLGLTTLMNKMLESWGVDTADRPWLGAVVLVSAVAALLIIAIILVIVVLVLAVVIVVVLIVCVTGAAAVAILVVAVGIIVSISALTAAEAIMLAPTLFGDAVIAAAIALIGAIVSIVTVPLMAMIEIIKDCIVGLVTATVMAMAFSIIIAALLAIITVLAQILLNALISSGLIYRFADAVGPAVGMNESQTKTFALALQGCMCLTAILFGASVPPEGFEYRYGTSDQTSEIGKKADLEYDEEQIMNRLVRIFQFMGKTVGETYAQNLRTAAQERLDKEDEKYESLRAIFQKLIKLMQKMLEKITAAAKGGQGATDMSDITNEFKTICGEMNGVTGTNFDPSSFDSSQITDQFQMIAQQAAFNMTEDDIRKIRDKLAEMGIQAPVTDFTTSPIPTDGQTA